MRKSFPPALPTSQQRVTTFIFDAFDTSAPLNSSVRTDTLQTPPALPFLPPPTHRDAHLQKVCLMGNVIYTKEIDLIPF